MVLQKENEMELSVLAHSDDMRRVSTRTQRYTIFFFFFFVVCLMFAYMAYNNLAIRIVYIFHFHIKNFHFCHIQRYFYGPIDGTPFTLAIALPDKYGMYELNSQEEIRHSHQNGEYPWIIWIFDSTFSWNLRRIIYSHCVRQKISSNSLNFLFSYRIFQRKELASASRMVNISNNFNHTKDSEKSSQFN